MSCDETTYTDPSSSKTFMTPYYTLLIYPRPRAEVMEPPSLKLSTEMSSLSWKNMLQYAPPKCSSLAHFVPLEMILEIKRQLSLTDSARRISRPSMTATSPPYNAVSGCLSCASSCSLSHGLIQ